MRGFIFFVDAPFAAIPIDIGQFVHKECVFFIQGRPVEVFYRGKRLLGGIVFDEGETGRVSRDFLV